MEGGRVSNFSVEIFSSHSPERQWGGGGGGGGGDAQADRQNSFDQVYLDRPVYKGCSSFIIETRLP